MNQKKGPDYNVALWLSATLSPFGADRLYTGDGYWVVKMILAVVMAPVSFVFNNLDFFHLYNHQRLLGGRQLTTKWTSRSTARNKRIVLAVRLVGVFILLGVVVTYLATATKKRLDTDTNE